jgi:hypothetical protein
MYLVLYITVLIQEDSNMAAVKYFYDRVDIYVDNIAYLPDGDIRSFSMNATYNSKPVQGQSPDGKATGIVVGNTVIDDISWTEYLVDQDDFIDWRAFTLANPNAQIMIVPVSLATGTPKGPAFIITGLSVKNIKIGAPSEGEPMTRDCSFNAVSSSNL